MADSMSMTLEGVEHLEKILDGIVAEDGSKAMNKALRQATRKVCKEVLLPRVKDLIPSDSGDLENALVVRAVKRSRGKVGHFVGFRDPLFKGDTFYGGFVEFGHEDRGGGHVPADSFLRRPLYENESQIRAVIEQELRQWVQERNREKPG